MMSAAALASAIRAKKKKMEEDHSDAVKLSGIPMDATDILVNKSMEPGEAMSENEPKEHGEDSPALDPAGEAPEHQYPDDPKQINQPEDGEVEMRKAKMKSMLSRMGK